LSESNHTRSQFRTNLLRRHAALAVELHRSPAPTIEQRIALARIRVRLAARGNRHELGKWDRAGALDVAACFHCGARARLDVHTATEDVGELLARRCS
jgi:hypothetical protein